MWLLRPLPNSDKQITYPHHPRFDLFCSPIVHPGFKPLNLALCWLDTPIVTRGSSGLNLLAPRAALPLAFDWLFLGPELSWVFLCSSHSFRARDARFAPMKAWQLSCITAMLLAASVMWTMSPTRWVPLASSVYDIEPADGNERSAVGRIGASEAA